MLDVSAKVTSTDGAHSWYTVDDANVAGSVSAVRGATDWRTDANWGERVCRLPIASWKVAKK